MNKIIIPLLILLGISVFSVALILDTFAQPTLSEVAVSSNSRVVNFEFGQNNQRDFPTGTVATSGGYYMAYPQRTDPFVTFVSANHELIFQKSPDGITVTPQVVVDTTSLAKVLKWRDISLFVSGTTIDIIANEIICFDPDPPCSVGNEPLSNLTHYRSTNDGVSFGSGTVIVNALKAFSMWFEGDGDNLSIIYLDQGSGLLQFKKSSNGGISFGSPVTIDPNDGTVSAVGSQSDVILDQSVDGTKYHIMYQGTDPVNSDTDIFYSRSIDSGATFTTPIIVSGNGTEGGGQPYIMIDGTELTLLFTSNIAGAETFSQVRSSNSGVSFSAQEDIFVGTTCDWDLIGVDSQHTTQFRSKIWTMCIGKPDINGGTNLFVARSTDMGANWGSLVSVAGDPNDGAECGGIGCQIKAVGDNVYVWWKFIDDQSPFDFGNAFVLSEDAGVTYSSQGNFNLLGTHSDPHINGFEGDLWIGTTDELQKDVVFQFGTFPFVVQDDRPVITLNGASAIVLEIGDTYTEFGATCIDLEDGSLPVTIGGDTVVTTAPATFTITYDCVDSVPQSAIQETRSVIIVDVPTTTIVTETVTTGGGVGSPVSLTPEVEGITPEQQLAFDQALADAIASIEPSEGNIVETIIQTFFEFIVIDTVHQEIQLQSFLDNERLGFRWSTGDDLVIVSATPALSPFMFTFEQFPVVRVGSGAFVSTNFILYNLEIPRNECSAIITVDCVEKIRYEIPVTVNAIINGTQVSDTGTITVDLTEDEIDPILLIILSTMAIPVIAVIIQRSRGRSTVQPLRRLIS